MGHSGQSLFHDTRENHPETHHVPAGAAASSTEAVPADSMRPEWEGWVLRWAWAVPVFWLLCQALAFNGQWRVSLDSAIYRHVARSIAAGEGYAVLGEQHTQIYPGLPLLLGALERYFGPAVWPAELVMVLLAALTVVFTFLLFRRIAAPWVAVVITTGVAFNANFFLYSHELLTDIPFLLGVTMALWGWEAITDPGWLRRLRAGAALLLGLGLAASMRPTFWVLAAAWGLACIGGLLVNLLRAARERDAPGERIKPAQNRPLVRPEDRARAHRRSWRFYLGCLLVVLFVGLVFMIADPRTGRVEVFGGAYEAEVLERLRTLGRWMSRWPGLTWTVLHDHLPSLFFAERIVGLNLIASVGLLAGVAMFARRRPLWGLIVLMLLVIVYLASSAPRYYLMVLPILWAGWLTIVTRLAGYFQTTRGRSIFMGVCIGVVLAANLGHVGKLIVEQRRTPFIEHHAYGRYAPLMAAGAVIREHTEPDDVIIGPYARVLAYASHRKVLGPKDLFADVPNSERHRAQAIVESPATWMVFPAEGYRHKDDSIRRLVEHLVIVPDNVAGRETHEIGQFGDYTWYLSRFTMDPYALDTMPSESEED